MKRLSYILMLIFVASFVSISEANAQQLSKKELRAQDAAMKKERLMELINSQNYQFVATDLISSGKAAFSNIRLRQLFYVRISHNRFVCYLPIYGTVSPVGPPTLLRTLDISTEDFEQTIEESKRSTSVYVTAKDDRSNRNYKFTFVLSVDGRMSTMIVSSDFSTPVTFRGDFNL